MINATAHLKRHINHKLRERWSPEQALAIYDLLNEFGEIIWHYYRTELDELIAERTEYNQTLQHYAATYDENSPF